MEDKNACANAIRDGHFHPSVPDVYKLTRGRSPPENAGGTEARGAKASDGGESVKGGAGG